MGVHRPYNIMVLLLVAAWLVPLGAVAAGAGVLLPVVVLAAFVAVQRGSDSLLDRLVVGLAQAFGAMCAGGLLITWWPWGMNPVLVAGLALSVTAVIAGWRGVTRPTFDRRDALVGGGWLVLTALLVAPFAARDLGGRLGLLATGEDLRRHYGLFDAIRHVQGFAFLRMGRAEPVMPDDGILTYPQGTHFLYALLGRFAGVGADGVSGMRWFIWCELGAFAFAMLAVLWAIRRVAGPGPSWPALLLVLLPVGTYLICGDLMAVLMRGFTNELVGLGLVAILVAVLARPLHRLGEQTLTVSVLIAGISFTYYLYVVPAGLLALLWAARRWRPGRRLWLLLPVAACAALALLVPLRNSGANNGNVLLLAGTALSVDRPVLIVLVLLVALAVPARRGLRTPARRTVGVALALVLAADAALAVYQLAAVGHTVYYFEKLLHVTLVVALVGLGAGVRFVRRFRPSLAASLAACALLAGLGGSTHTHPGAYGLKIVLGVEKGSPDAGRDAVAMTRRYPDGPIVVDLMHSRYANFFATSCAAAMRRQVAATQPWIDLLLPGAPMRTLDDVDALVRRTPGQVLLLTGDPSIRTLAGPNGPSNLDIARAMAARYPDRVRLAAS